MSRRYFMTLLGGATVAPFATRAEQSRVPVLGFLGSASEARYTATRASILTGLNEAGFVEKQNLLIDYRWADFQYERLPALAAELVKRPVDAIFATGSVVSAVAAKSATSTIPIVFANGSDPVQYGLVASLNRPGGNATGFIPFEFGNSGKWLELLKEIAPGVKRAAILRDAALPLGIGQLAAIQSVAPTFGMELRPVGVGDLNEIDRAITAFARDTNGALIVTVSPWAISHRETIIKLAARHKLPATYPYRFFVTDGGLISYGPDPIEPYQRAAGYVDRILKGERPADLPVQAPTKYELVINLKTAKALGLVVPPTLLARVDEVIE